MNRLLAVLVVVIAIFGVESAVARGKGSTVAIPEALRAAVKVTDAGALRAKDGYRLTVTGGEAQITSIVSGQISGTVNCMCSGGSTGSCSLVSSGSDVSCSGSTCCKMDLIVSDQVR